MRLKHCIDCEDWRRYVFCVSNDNYNNDCHCDVLKNDSIENTFEGESKSMVKLENMVKKKCRAMHDIEESQADTQFWGKGFLRIIDEFENADNGRLMPKNRGGKKQPRNIGVLKFSDNYWKDQQVIYLTNFAKAWSLYVKVSFFQYHPYPVRPMFPNLKKRLNFLGISTTYSSSEYDAICFSGNQKTFLDR